MEIKDINNYRITNQKEIEDILGLEAIFVVRVGNLGKEDFFQLYRDFKVLTPRKKDPEMYYPHYVAILPLEDAKIQSRSLWECKPTQNVKLFRFRDRNEAYEFLFTILHNKFVP